MGDLREDLIRLAEEMEEVSDGSADLSSEDWADRIRTILASHPAPSLAPPCHCTYEAGDSPCPMHGMDEEPAPSPSVSRDAPRTDPLSRRRGINEARAAFERVAAGKPVRCIPATAYDDDMVLIDVLAEWEQMRWAALPTRPPAPSPRSEAESGRSPMGRDGWTAEDDAAEDAWARRPIPPGGCTVCKGTGSRPLRSDAGTICGSIFCGPCAGSGRAPVPAESATKEGT